MRKIGIVSHCFGEQAGSPIAAWLSCAICRAARIEFFHMPSLHPRSQPEPQLRRPESRVHARSAVQGRKGSMQLRSCCGKTNQRRTKKGDAAEATKPPFAL